MSNSNIEKNEFLELEILNHIEHSPKLTTRIIASHIGCNLRLTHALLKKLISKGLLDVKKINSRNWHYCLTSRGISEKANKTYKFFEFSMQFYQRARERSSLLCKTLSEKGRTNIAFFGCGNLAEITYLSVRENRLNLIEIYGSGKTEFMGHRVLSIEDIKNSKADALIICIYDKKHPLVQTLKELDIENLEWLF
jgi:predicted transcriptional regulator